MTEGTHEEPLKAGVVCYDLDGTVADDYHRLHYALDGNWEEYFNEEKVALDPVFPGAHSFLRYHGKNSNEFMVYLTARWEMMRECTQAWIDANGLPREPLYMKENGRSGQAAQYKFEIMKELVDSGHLYAVLYDDKQDIIDYINAQGDERIRAQKPAWVTYPEGARLW